MRSIAKTKKELEVLKTSKTARHIYKASCKSALKLFKVRTWIGVGAKIMFFSVANLSLYQCAIGYNHQPLKTTVLVIVWYIVTFMDWRPFTEIDKNGNIVLFLEDDECEESEEKEDVEW